MKDDTSFQKFLPRSAKPSMIKVWPWLNFWPGTDVWFETDPRLEANPWPGNAFLLFPNVHLRATLSITARQTMANGYFAAFGRQKPRCDAQNSPMPLTVCSASKFVIFQYRQSVSRPRPTHYGWKCLIYQNLYSCSRIWTCNPRNDRTRKRGQAIHCCRQNPSTRWCMDIHDQYIFPHIRKFTSPSCIR